jgi:hypothetical protein
VQPRLQLAGALRQRVRQRVARAAQRRHASGLDERRVPKGCSDAAPPTHRIAQADIDSAESSSSARTTCGGVAVPPDFGRGEATASAARGDEPLRIELSARHARERAEGVSATGTAGSTGASDIASPAWEGGLGMQIMIELLRRTKTTHALIGSVLRAV